MVNSAMTLTEFNRAIYMFASSDGYHALRGSNGISMGGTPLDQTILMIPPMLREFKRNNGVEKVTVMFLTDGESTEHMYQSASYGPDPKKDRVFIRNQWNHKTYEVKANVKADRWNREYQDFDSGSWTSAYLNMVRDVTDATIIGYYLVNGRQAKNLMVSYKNYTVKTEEALKMEFRNNKYFSVEKFGYDSYFFLLATALDEKDGAVSEIKSGLSSKALASAYTKMQTGKAVNRVFLTEFVKLVA
jgi:hypothetical protein